ncbi:Flp family type IVb pilin [Nitrosomonas sp. Nm33]|uniref:Flp family type IVb pilin n=1 Tax=Nitrosomonas sp. Nm33 TaxID=133724 RepID=UPI000899C767|nr:Flp family type IVb pilin [Nitrosomonas sp. Nm33]SDY03211.1 pilus assembly protein Flp/PilA [Nitrosomonas sp. Nm33]
MMSKLVQSIKQFINDEEGIGAVEYAIIIAVMAAAITALWPDIKTAISTAIGKVTTAVTS